MKMVNKGEKEICLGPKDKEIGCCRVESVISIDDRGQMVLPKEIREKAGIGAGDKLAVVIMEKDQGICCISLIKAKELEQMVKGLLGPVMKEIIAR